MKELQPINQNVLLDLDNIEKEQISSGGIIIPDSAQKQGNIARVVGISILENAEIALGDTILYKDFSGVETEFEGKKYLLIQYGDILAKVVETDEI